MPGARVGLATQGFSVLRSTDELPRLKHLGGDLPRFFVLNIAHRNSENQLIYKVDLHNCGGRI